MKELKKPSHFITRPRVDDISEIHRLSDRLCLRAKGDVLQILYAPCAKGLDVSTVQPADFIGDRRFHRPMTPQNSGLFPRLGGDNVRLRNGLFIRAA